MVAAVTLLSSVVIFGIWNGVHPQEQRIISSRSTLFVDIGSIQQCAVADDISYCSEYVTYEVPASIAWLANIIDSDIRSRVENPDLDDGECREILKETYCKKRFPRCSMENSMVLFETSENCAERLQSSCPDRASSLIEVGYCNFTQAALNSGTCNALSGHEDLQHCNMLENNHHVSNWMHQYVWQTDLELQQDFRFLGTHLECWELYRDFMCSYIGRCVGQRVQLINNQEMCDSILNWLVSCYR